MTMNALTGQPGKGRRAGIASTPILVGMISIALLAVGAVMLRDPGDSSARSAGADLFSVTRGSFEITVPASGELTALKQTEIASRLDGRATILTVVDEGTWIEEGDVLIRFDAKELEENIKDATDAVTTARTALITAQSNLDIRRRANASELEKADVDIELADLAFRVWAEGQDLSARQKHELSVKTAKKNHERLVARFDASKDLLDQKFISRDEYLQDEIKMIEASSALEEAKLAKQVYEDYESKKEKKKLESELQQAKDKRDEYAGRHKNEIATLEAEVKSKSYHVESKEKRLAEHLAQVEMCEVRAPQAGLVVYTSSLSSGRWGRNDREAPKVGAEVRRNDPIMLLPDTSRMVAEVKVNEALSGKIRAGNGAVVFSDAKPDMPLRGEVLSVGVLAETGGWRDPNRRDYTVRIGLDSAEGLDLKPAMRCRANIYVGSVDDALYVPISSVLRRGSVAFVYKPDGSGFAEHQVQVGLSSELYIEVTAGLEEGDQVFLREPPADRITKKIADDPDGPGDGAADRGRPGPPSGGEVRKKSGENDDATAGEKPVTASGGPAERPAGRATSPANTAAK